MIEIIPNWHPVFVHFPIAFTMAALAFTAVGTLFGNWPYAAQCRMTGRWMLWGAALFALIAAVFGWFAFNGIEHDEVSHAAMILHRNWALGALAALLALAVWDVWHGRFRKAPSYGFLGGLLLAWLLVTSTAWHGAELVYRHGLGVMSLPDTHAEQDMVPHDAVSQDAAPHEAGGHEHDHTH